MSPNPHLIGNKSYGTNGLPSSILNRFKLVSIIINKLNIFNLENGGFIRKQMKVSSSKISVNYEMTSFRMNVLTS